MKCNIIFLFFFPLLILGVPAVAQVNILNGDGTALTTVWCNEDSLHPVQGLPAGGSFSGFGAVNIGGAWYFNPKQAAEQATVFPYTCSLAYIPPPETGYSRIYRTMRINAPVLIDAGPDRPICQNGSFELRAAIVYGSSYRFTWSPGAYLEDSTRNPARGRMPLHGSETFYLTVRDVNSGCMAYDTVTLWDHTVFAHIIGDLPDSICTGSILSAEAEVFEGYEYRWLPGDSTIIPGLKLDYAYRDSGSFRLMLIVDNGQCQDTAAHDIRVEDFQLGLTADRDLVNWRETINLSSYAKINPYTIISWEPAEAFSDQNALVQQIPADSSRIYTIIGRSKTGCQDTASVFVRVKPLLHIPDAFTPNNDGRNDRFRIGSYGDIVRVLQFDIFDRWGKKVWDGNGPAGLVGWDGTVNGMPAPVGTYFYVVRLENLQGERVFRQGDVSLIR